MILVRFINTLFSVYYTLLIIRIFMSWIPIDRNNYYIVQLCKITDPYLDIFRKVIPSAGMIDFSPIVAIIALEMIKRVVFFILYLIV